MHEQARMKWVRRGIMAALASVVSLGCKSSSQKSDPPLEEVMVIRVESPTPEQPGAEHCADAGKECRPLAAQQKLPAQGVVRTFAGGRVSLEFQGGGRVDLDELSQVQLAPHRAKLIRGDFTVEPVPLIAREDFVPLTVDTAQKTLAFSAQTPTQLTLSVQDDETLATVHRGRVDGVPIEGTAPRAGDSIRLTQAQAFRTSPIGGELPTLSPNVFDTQAYENVSPPAPDEARGMGTMSARLPNTDQIRDGVFLKKHHVRVVIRDGFATTEIEEEFENRTPQVLEGRFVFPVPGDASVSRLGLWVGDRLMEGEVVEKARAAAIYKSIVDRPLPRDPALLDYEGGGKMSLKVFPILPHKTRRMVVAYNQALSAEGGILRYVYPLSLGKGKENQIEEFSLTVHLRDENAELRHLKVHGYETKTGWEGQWQRISFTRKNFVPRRDFALSVRRSPPAGAEISTFAPKDASKLAGPLAAVALPKKNSAEPSLAKDANERHDDRSFFALRLGADLPASMTRPPHRKLDRAIVLDTSHSQSAKSILAQGALALSMVRALDPDEHFVLLSCDSACAAVSSRDWSSASKGSLAARTASAKAWLGDLQPGGSSDIAGALMTATTHLQNLPDSGHARQLVLLGDGNVTSGELSSATIFEHVRPVLERAEIDLRIVGVGRTVDHDLLTQLAARLDATVDFLGSDASFSEAMFDLTIGLRKPVIENVSLELPPGFELSKSLGHQALRLGQEWIVTGRYEEKVLQNAQSTITVAGSLNGQPYRLERRLSPAAASSAANPLVVRLWARDRIEELSERPQTSAIQASIVELSTRYRTMSRYTSFLVLESEKMYADFGVERTSRSPSDQADASFLDAPRDNAEGESPRSSLQSLLDEDQVVAPAALPSASSRPRFTKKSAAPEARAAPRPQGEASASSDAQLEPFLDLSEAEEAAPAPAPRPRPASPKAHPGDPMLGGLTRRGTSSSSRSSSSAGSGASLRPRRTVPPRRPTSHLRISKADDVWRSWGDKQHERFLDTMTDPEPSRADFEAAILGLLKLGRFSEARKFAEQFFSLDPDNQNAHITLAYAAAVHGDHELSRKMLDVRTETVPRDAQAHFEAARSFLAVHDDVRACAHLRSYAELTLAKDAVDVARNCWTSLTSPTRADFSASKKPLSTGHLQVEVKCDDSTLPADCPSPIVVTPAGQVLSPWTPGPGRSDRSSVSSLKIRTGDYYVLVGAGAPESKGRIFIRGISTSKSLPFSGGSLHTVARVQASYY